jgi:ribosome-associated translation inhibitor RaiA
MTAIRIQVVGKDSISPQARTYAEYRMFAALAPFAERVRGARVVLRPLEGDVGCERVVCAVTINAEGDGGTLRIRTTGAHVYAAINRAVERVAMAIEASLADRGVDELVAAGDAS